MTEQPELKLTPELQLKSARQTLISQLELYGVGARQAQIQVDSLVEAARQMGPADLEELREDSAKLSALEAAGVDNWSGYDYAMELHREGL